jgi:hypothetical protein
VSRDHTKRGDPVNRPLLALILIVATLTPGFRPLTGVALAQTPGPGGTPQLAAQLETIPYAEAAPAAIHTYAAIVLDGVDAFPDAPSPEQVKDSDLRKQLRALRLMMDLSAFAYEPLSFEAYRSAVDSAYETMGTYQDLFVTSQLAGAPIDPEQQAARLATMQAALAPFRLDSFRDELTAFFSQPSSPLAELDEKDRPRLWKVAGVPATDDLDAVGNAALLGQAVLRSLVTEGLTVDDILDPAQEARFHDVRKAMRAILDLATLYPSLSQATGDVQTPLDDLVDDYGDVNDLIVAYHAAQDSGLDIDARAASVQEAYAPARSAAIELVNGGQLQAFVSRLEAVQTAHTVTIAGAPAAELAVMPSSAPARERRTEAGGPMSISLLKFASQVTNKGEPAGSRIEFPRDNDGVWVSLDYANVPAGSKLTRVVRFNGDDYNWDGNQFGHLDCCQDGGSGRFAFRVKRLDGDDGWLPGGAYDVRLYMNGSEVAHGGFGVNGARGSGKDEVPGGNNKSNSRHRT